MQRLHQMHSKPEWQHLPHLRSPPIPAAPQQGSTQDSALIQVPDPALPSEMPRGSAGSSAACTAGQTKPPPSQWGTAAWRRPGGGERKVNEKAGWHCNQQEKGTAGNRHWVSTMAADFFLLHAGCWSKHPVTRCPESPPVQSIVSGQP